MHVTRGGRNLASMCDPVQISFTEDGAEISASSDILSANIMIRCAAGLQCSA